MSTKVAVKKVPLIAVSTLAIHIPIGAVYAYSLWKDPLLEAYGWEHAQTSLAFSFAIFMLGMSAAFLGHLVEHRSPRFAAYIGGPLYCLGYIISGIATHEDVSSKGLYYLGYLTLGSGCGILYVCPVSTMCKYLPNNRGLATGIAIAGFGFGSFLASPIITYLQDNTTLCAAHMWIALIYFVPIMLGGTYIAPPPAGWKPGMKFVVVDELDQAADKEITIENAEDEELVDNETKAVSDESDSSSSEVEKQTSDSSVVANSEDSDSSDSESDVSNPAEINSESDRAAVIAHAKKQPIDVVTEGKAALKMTRFYILWLLMFINISSGLGFISDAKPMAVASKAALSADQAKAMVGVMGLFNAAGRFIFSSLSDFIGRPSVYVTIFVIQIIASEFLPVVEDAHVFEILMYVNISCYGAGFATLPAFLSDLFSMKSLASTHGYTLTAWGIAGLVGPNVFSYWVDEKGYNQAIRITAVYFMVALVISIGFLVWFYRARGENVADAVKEWEKCVLGKKSSKKTKKPADVEEEA